MKHDDDDELIPWEGDLPPRIDPGEYRAKVLSTKKVNRFGLTTMETLWRLLLSDSREKIELPSFCNLGPTKHPKIRAGSKLASWQRAVAEFTHGTASKVTMKAFKDFWFYVTVRTVTRNTKRDLHERDQYSVVDDILSVGGKLTDLADRLPIETAGAGYPAAIPSLGPMQKGGLSRCAACDEPTAFSYGGHSLCVTHAQQQAKQEGQG